MFIRVEGDGVTHLLAFWMPAHDSDGSDATISGAFTDGLPSSFAGVVETARKEAGEWTGARVSRLMAGRGRGVRVVFDKSISPLSTSFLVL